MADVNDQVDDQTVDQETEGDAPAVDPVKNLKSEFSRKFDNTNQRLEQLNQQLASMVDTIQSSLAPKKQEPTKSLKDLAFDDPEEYARIIEERAITRATERVAKQTQLSDETRNIVFSMQSKYSEFMQEGSEANQMAIQKAASLPAHLRGTPEGAKMVLLETIADLGLVPTSKKSSRSNDDFAISGQSKPSSARKSGDASKSVDPNTLAWMELLDPSFKDDPKRVANLAKISTRKSWTKYE